MPGNATAELEHCQGGCGVIVIRGTAAIKTESQCAAGGAEVLLNGPGELFLLQVSEDKDFGDSVLVP